MGYYSIVVWLCPETKLKLDAFVRPASNYKQLVFVPELSREK